MKNDSRLKQLSDDELVEQIVKSKKTELFEELYERYSSAVYNKCFAFTHNSDEAQDLAQDIFIRLFIKLGSFKGQSKFSSWLYAITYNYCVNYVNRSTSKKIERNAVHLDDQVLEIADVSKSSLFELKAEKLQKALELIDPDDKMILLLKYQDDVSVDEISNLLEIGKSAVKMRLKRARARVVAVYKKMVFILWTILLKR